MLGFVEILGGSPKWLNFTHLISGSYGVHASIIFQRGLIYFFN